jgi:alkylhydroperoxidase family enzyme
VRVGLAEHLAGLRAETHRECPGRVASLIDARIGQMITGSGSLDAFGHLSPAEQAVLAVAEQFAIDVHGVDDASMARLGEHYSASECVAIMFQMAFADGFTKLRRVLALEPQPPNVTEGGD